MNHLYMIAGIGSDLSQAANETARTFGWTRENFIAQCISFAIVAFLLHRFAYKPILQVLEDRRQRIAQGLADAEKSKTELTKAEAQRQEILSQANIQANKLIEEARAAAARVQEQETQKAIAQAEQIVTKAKEAAVQERARMMTDLKKEVGRLVVQTTATVTGKILTPEDHKRIADDTARQVAA